METIRLRPQVELRAAVEAAFRRHRERVLAALPGAEVEHVGSTAIPGALTKGDLDLLVRVDAGAFARAASALRRLYAVHQRENWTPTYASFADPDAVEPAVGVQLVVAGSADDGLFGPFRDALTTDADLLSEYNAVKRRHDGDSYERYTAVKGAFVERVLSDLGRPPA